MCTNADCKYVKRVKGNYCPKCDAPTDEFGFKEGTALIKKKNSGNIVKTKFINASEGEMQNVYKSDLRSPGTLFIQIVIGIGLVFAIVFGIYFGNSLYFVITGLGIGIFLGFPIGLLIFLRQSKKIAKEMESQIQ